MKRHLTWLVGALALASAACSSTPCQPQSPLLYVDLPGGTDSISSFTATGACGTVVGGCEPVEVSCQTSGCRCRYTLQVNPATFDATPDGICVIEVVAKDGGVFTKGLTYTANAGSCFGVSGPVGVTFIPVFSVPQVDAAAKPDAPDGGAVDADDAALDDAGD